MTALDDNSTVGKPLQIECNVTIPRGNTDNVDIIMWRVNDTVTNHTVVYMMNNNTAIDMNSQHEPHRVVYNIPSLQMSDDNTVYCCEAKINIHMMTTACMRISITLTVGK